MAHGESNQRSYRQNPRPSSAELERLVALGAQKTDVVPSGSWHVLADPDGNKFCLMAKRIPAEPEDFHD
ncbi:VOC family protein [Brevibacterium sp. H602]|uniref:VOC family protein n=1 Tax=Brevibacterium sp. H602 TaxID=3444316 RepID=UPI003EB8BAC2